MSLSEEEEGGEDFGGGRGCRERRGARPQAGLPHC